MYKVKMKNKKKCFPQIAQIFPDLNNGIQFALISEICGKTIIHNQYIK